MAALPSHDQRSTINDQRTPLKVGLTGGIGAGKSVVMRLFALLGVPAIDADTRARWLMTHDVALRADLLLAFGPEVFTAEGQLNRPWLAKRAFSEPDTLARLNALVHPAVGRDFAAWLEAQAGQPYIIKEAALIYEADIARSLDYVITVAAPLDVRIRRVLARDPHRTAADVQAIIEKQLPEEERQARADFVLWNDDRQPLLRQVLALDARLREVGKA